MVQPPLPGYKGKARKNAFPSLQPEKSMKRRRISGKHHSRKHNRAARRYKAINSPAFIMRGGIRL